MLLIYRLMIIPIPQPLQSLNSSPAMTFAFNQPPPPIPVVELPWGWHDHLQRTLYYPNIKHHLLHSPPPTFPAYSSWLSPSPCWYHPCFPRLNFSSATTITPCSHSQLSFSSLPTEHVRKIPNLGSNEPSTRFFFFFQLLSGWSQAEETQSISF